MKQKQYSPMSVAEMALSLYAANEGFLDDVDVSKVLDFEHALHAYMKDEHSDLLDKINASGDYNDEIKSGLKAGLEKFKATQSW
jgi:F-type H+-transporting ATPase subunit alpha